MKEEGVGAERLTVSVVEAAKMLGISRNLAYDLVRMKQLPAIRMGERRLVVPVSALKQWVEAAGAVEAG